MLVAKLLSHCCWHCFSWLFVVNLTLTYSSRLSRNDFEFVLVCTVDVNATHFHEPMLSLDDNDHPQHENIDWLVETHRHHVCTYLYFFHVRWIDWKRKKRNSIFPFHSIHRSTVLGLRCLQYLLRYRIYRIDIVPLRLLL